MNRVKRIALTLIFLNSLSLFSQIQVKLTVSVKEKGAQSPLEGCIMTVSDINTGSVPVFFITDKLGKADIELKKQGVYQVKVQKSMYFSDQFLLDMEAVPMNRIIEKTVIRELAAIGNAKPGKYNMNTDFESNVIYELAPSRFKYFSEKDEIGEDLNYRKDIKRMYDVLGVSIETKSKLSREQLAGEILRSRNIQIELENEKKALEVKYLQEEKKLAALEKEKQLQILEKTKAEKKLKENEMEFAKKRQLYLLLGLGILFASALFIANRLRITRQQKKVIEAQKTEVERQKKLVEEKQKEILDSIKYAQRIQRAHLPVSDIIHRKLNRLKRSQ